MQPAACLLCFFTNFSHPWFRFVRLITTANCLQQGMWTTKSGWFLFFVFGKWLWISVSLFRIRVIHLHKWCSKSQMILLCLSVFVQAFCVRHTGWCLQANRCHRPTMLQYIWKLIYLCNNFAVKTCYKYKFIQAMQVLK